MRQFQIVPVAAGHSTEWAVVEINPNGTRDWLTFYPTQAEAQEEADRLAEAEWPDGFKMKGNP